MNTIDGNAGQRITSHSTEALDNNPGRRLTSQLTEVLTGTRTLSNLRDTGISLLCQYITGVKNAADTYCNNVNNRGLSIQGSITSLKNLSDKISCSEVKIISKLEKLYSFRINSSKYLAMQACIKKNRLHLEQKVNKAEQWVSKLDASHLINIRGPEDTSLNEFKQAISEFKNFIDSVTVREVIHNNSPTEQQNNLPADHVDNPPSYDKCTLPTYAEAIKQ